MVRGTSEVDFDDRFWTGIPQINYVVDGLKITYPGQTTKIHTRNAAALRYWYETERLERSSSAIDTTSFRSAFTTCGQRVLVGGTGEDLRYTIDGVVTSEDNSLSVISDFDFAWQGYVLEVDGRLHFKPGVEIADSAGTALNIDNNMIRFIGAQPSPSLSDRVNACDMSIDQSSQHDWLTTDLEEVKDQTNIDRDGRRLTRNLGVRRFITNPYTARRLMAIALRRARAAATYSYQVAPGTNFENLAIVPGDLLLVTDKARGLAGERLMVIHQTLDRDWSVRLTLAEFPTGIYADTAVVRPQKPRQFRTTRSDLKPSAVTNLAATQTVTFADDGSLRFIVQATWDRKPFDTIVVVQDAADSTDRFRKEVVVDWNQASVDVPKAGAYTVIARHRNLSHISSETATVNITVSLDSIGPPTPVLDVLNQTHGFVAIVFAASTRLDIQSVQIKYNFESDIAAEPAAITDANFASATDLGFLSLGRSNDGKRYAGFPVPNTGAFRFAARYLIRTGALGPIADLGKHILTAAQTYTWRGAWDAATAYAVSDLVSNDGNSWIAVTANTNSEPTTSSSDWNIFAAGGNEGVGFRWRGGWANTTAYVIDDIVSHDGSAWIATVNSMNEEPSGSSNFWDIYAEKGEDGDSGTVFRWRDAWDSTTAYNINDLVRHSGTAWVAITNSTNQEPVAGSSNWNEFAEGGAAGAPGAQGEQGDPGDGFAWQGEWVNTTTYAIRDVVHHNRDAWVATQVNLNSEPSTTSTDWNEFALGGEIGATGQSGADGSGYQIVFQRTMNDTAPTAITTTAGQRQDDDFIPTSWTDDPTGVDSTNRFEWASIRIGASGSWNEFSSPSLWSRFSEDGARGAKGDQGDAGARGASGDDGSGFEMVFQRTSSANTPTAIVTTTAQRAMDDFVPTGWNDNPTGVNNTNQYEWVSIRVGSTGDWNEFSAPSLWSKFGAKGDKGDQGDAGEGFNYRGRYSATTAYEANDLVRYQGASYIALQNTTGNTPSDSSVFWDQFATAGSQGEPGDGFVWRGDWNNSTAYSLRDIVHHDGAAWVAIVANTNSEPATTSANWDEFAQKGEKGDAGDRGATGSSGSDGPGYQFVFRLTTTETSPTAITTTSAQRSNDSFVPTDWTNNPSGVTSTNRYEWVSVRIGTSGAWAEFSSPAIWARFSEDGDDGSTGARGAKGDKGDTGARGATGAQGAQGEAGDDGSGFEMVFRRTTTSTAPTAITTTSAQRSTDDFTPTNWTDNPTGVDNSNQYEWVSIRTGSTGSWSEFSSPSLWAKFGEKGDTGDAGSAGADGPGYQFVFRTTTTNTAPTSITTTSAQRSSDTFVPTNWTNNPSGVDSTNQYEWVSVRIGSSGNWAEFSTPSIWAKFGVDGDDGSDGARGAKGDKGDTGDRGATGAAGSDGDDGSGFEMVFRRTSSSTAPTAITTTNAQRGMDDFVPTNWSDDPTGVNNANQYEWVAIRVGTTGNWSEFSTPSLWAKFGEKGDKGDQGEAGQGFNYRGEYDSATAYNPHDLVHYQGSSYICLIATTGRTPQAAVAGQTNYWDRFAVAGTQGEPGDGFTWRGEWNNATAYSVRDVVHNDGSAWVALLANTNSEPTSTSTNWDAFAEKGDQGDKGDKGDQGDTGAAGSDGSDGPGYQFVFRRTTNDTAPTSITTTNAQRANDSYVPTSWTNNPTGVDSTNQYEWVSVRTGSSGSWGEFSAPAVWAKFGEDGDDGTDGTDGTDGARGAKGDQGDQGPTGDAGADGSGFEFVFLRNNSSTAPTAITTTAAQRTMDDFVPTGWTDDPTGVTSANQYEWVSVRTGTSGAWSEFSTPSLWAKFGADGAAGAKGDKGDRGEAGDDGSGYTWRGVWNNSTAYVVNDIVRHNGRAWVCLVDNTNDEPA